MRAAYDLHIHSCLSPCADNDNTPNNIVHMAALKGLSVIALTDHNSVKNVPAAQRVGEESGVLVLAGMELTTAEDIHLVCLFPSYAEASAFSEEVEARRMRVPNRERVFGEQIVMNERDEETGRESDLLITTSNLPLAEAVERVRALSGVPFPAHIDKAANGILAILGDIPAELNFTALELSKNADAGFLMRHAYASRYRVLRDSDAHYLADINEPRCALEVSALTPQAVLAAISKPMERA